MHRRKLQLPQSLHRCTASLPRKKKPGKNLELQAQFTTVSGFPIQRLYTAADLAGWDSNRDLGYPGEPPYTRGIHSTMHRGRLWTMRQFAGFGAAEDTNQRFRYL